MAPPKLPKRLKRSVVLRIKLRPDEARRIRHAARHAGMPTATWARAVVTGKAGCS